MKKMCVLVLSAILVFTVCFSMPVAAASNQYVLSELGLTVTIPEDYTAITRDTPESDPIFAILGMTKADIVNQFEESNIYLNAISYYSNEEIVITMDENTIDNLSSLKDSALNVVASMLVDECAKYGMNITYYVIYHHAQAKFIKLYFTDAAKTVHGLQYYTVCDGKAMNFTIRSYAGSISAEQENAIQSTVDSVLFDDPPLEPEQVEDTHPFQYTDADSGLSFIVPANWQQEEMFENREYLDVKFTCNQDTDCAMTFTSVDVWDQMSPFDRFGYTRSEMDNSLWTLADIAEMYNTTMDQISKVTYKGKEYFKGKMTSSSDVYGIDFEATVTQLIRIENGWLYLFQFVGTDSHERYFDFINLVESVIYPPVVHEKKPEPTKQTTLPTYPSSPNLQNSSPNTSVNSSPNITANASQKASSDHTGVIVVVLLLVGVFAIVAASAVIRKKKRKSEEQFGYSTNENAPEAQSASDTAQACFCKKCGQKLPSDSIFCHICGARND